MSVSDLERPTDVHFEQWRSETNEGKRRGERVARCGSLVPKRLSTEDVGAVTCELCLKGMAEDTRQILGQRPSR